MKGRGYHHNRNRHGLGIPPRGIPDTPRLRKRWVRQAFFRMGDSLALVRRDGRRARYKPTSVRGIEYAARGIPKLGEDYLAVDHLVRWKVSAVDKLGVRAHCSA